MIQPTESSAAAFPSRACRRGHGLVLAAGLLVALPRLLRAENSLAYKYQDYQEGDDRIRVRNHNARATLDLGTSTSLRVRGVIDTITGATPTGQPAPEGSDEVPLAELEDERRAVVVDLGRTFGTHTFNLQYAYSTEDDYVSNGYAVNWLVDLNEKNTQLQFGFAYNDDRIQPVFFEKARKKASRDFMVGLVQLLDKDTVLTANLTHGTSDGYLSDPYKLVQKTVDIVPGFPLALTFPENRPGSRDKTIGFVQLARHVERLRASLEVSARLYTDSHGIDSDTLEFTWLQKLGERVVLSPFVRWYRQGAADFYHVDLDATDIVPAEPVGSNPYYSSDYRLSRFEAVTLGLKLVYRHGERWSADLAWERYDMRGRDRETPDSAYITAEIVTAGLTLWF